MEIERTTTINAAVDKLYDVVHRLFYKVLGDYYQHRTDIESLFGLELADVVYQMPYSRLSQKLKERYDRGIMQMVNSLGTPNEFSVYAFGVKNLKPTEIIELTKAFDLIAKINTGEVKINERGDLSSSSKFIEHLAGTLKESAIAIEFLIKNKGETNEAIDGLRKDLSALFASNKNTNEN